MKTLLSLFMVLALSSVACGQDSTPGPDPRFSEVRELIISEVDDEGVPSIAVAVAEGGEIVWEEAFGWSDVENQVRATPHTMYRLGSITKTITATGLMILVEEGRVDLDRPAADYLPDDIRPRAFEGKVGDVTVRHLLNHRAGMPAYAESFFEDDPGGRRPFGETVRRYGIISYPPGQSFIYCNLGYQLVAKIISEISGMGYTEFIEKKVFSPLGMTETQVYDGVPLGKPYAVCYTKAGERIPPYLDGYPGGGCSYASAHDLMRFAMFHLGDDLPNQNVILSGQTVSSMQAEYPPSNRQYGIGWYLDGSERGFRSVYHGGEGPGVDNIMRLFPTEDIAAVVLCNTEWEGLYEIQKAIFEVLIPELAEPEPTEESSTSQESEDPDELYGTWRGQIAAYDRELGVELVVDSAGAVVRVGNQPQDDVEIWVLTPAFLLGMFDARIPTPDNERYPYRNRLAVIRDGNRMYGAVISVGRMEDRAGHYELSSHVELRRTTQD